MIMKKNKTRAQSILLTGAVSLVLGVLPIVAQAEFAGNIGLASNYVWRGVTQTNDQAAISGGLDYGHDIGFYAGCWVSNTDFDTTGATPASIEVDVYLGFSREVGDFSYDVGLISYGYPQDTSTSDIDIEEFYIGGSWKMLSLQLSNDTQNGDFYFEAAVDIDIAKDLVLGIHFGDYGYDVNSSTRDYSDYSISLSKDDWAFTVSNTDVDGDDYRAVVSYSKSVDLI